MHPNLVVYIFATAFVLIQCEFKYTASSPAEDDKTHHFEIDSCEREEFVWLRLTDAMEKFPAPRALEKFVKLSGNYTYNPSMVVVKRCDGLCKGGLSVQAVETADRVFLAVQSEVGKKPQCVNVMVEEHINCGCTCLKTRKDCNRPHKLDEKTCTCICPHKHAENDCRKKYSGIKYWNATTCSCECNKSATTNKCMTNSPKMWNEKTCKCMVDEKSPA